MPRWHATVALFATLVLLACSGDIGGKDGETDGRGRPATAPGADGGPLDPGAPGSDGGGIGDPGGGDDPAVPAGPDVPGIDRSKACDARFVPASLVRRLSHVEYMRTLRDLFPSVDIPEQDLVEDLRVHGFENNTTSLNPSPVLTEQYADSSTRIAELVANDAQSVLPCVPAGLDMACASSFIEQFGMRAFRRPLTSDEQQRYEGFFAEQMAAISFRGALELTLAAFLQSPQFLYRLEVGVAPESGDEAAPLDDYEMASRLSYLLWQSMPDSALFEAAADGELETVDQVAAQARRMLDDPRATSAMVDFHRQWLDFDRLLTQNKEPALFPSWNTELRDAMREESDRFIEHVWDSGEPWIEALLTSQTSYVNPPLAELYGVSTKSDAFTEVELPPERAGILTRGTFLASLAHSTNGSPPLRGVAVLDALLCNRPAPPPPTADTSTPVSDGAPKTNRMLFEERTAPEGCQACHAGINGIGFGFEAFDSIGQFRSEDNGLPVDATGELIGTDVDGAYDGAADLERRLAQSEQVGYCSVRNVFRFAFGRNETSADWCKLDALYDALQRNDGDVRELLVEIATSYEMMHRPAEAP